MTRRVQAETFQASAADGQVHEVAIAADLGGGQVRVELLDPGYEGTTMTLRRKSLVSRGSRAVRVNG